MKVGAAINLGKQNFLYKVSGDATNDEIVSLGIILKFVTRFLLVF